VLFVGRKHAQETSVRQTERSGEQPVGGKKTRTENFIVCFLRWGYRGMQWKEGSKSNSPGTLSQGKRHRTTHSCPAVE